MKVLAKKQEARSKLIEGINIVNDIVSSTLGPKGRNVVLDRGYMAPVVTNDGVSIARAIEVPDDLLRQGVEGIKEVAQKTNEMAGDGTTTSILLATAIVTESMKYSESPMEIRRALKKAGTKVVEELKKISRPIKNKRDILNIATISAESEELGKIITDTIEAIGNDGVISVEESKLPYIESKIVEGYEVLKGFVSPYMANDKEMKKAEYSNVKVFTFTGKLSNIAEILPFLQKVSQKTKELVIFCEDVDATVVTTFVANKASSMFNGLIIKVQSQKNEVIEDISFLTGSKLISKEAGYKLEDLTEACLGNADKVIATKDKTIILNGKSTTLKKKIAELKENLPKITNDNEYDLAEKRIARLQGGIAVISVGAKTETEMRDLYYKMEDAVNATKSAIEEGIVEGGGMTLYRISQILGTKDIGERILKSALHAPLKKIIENCGLDYTDILLNMPKGKGYDARNDIYVDLLKAGIVDPTKVERCSIENALSYAQTVITSDAIVALVREDSKKED